MVPKTFFPFSPPKRRHGGKKPPNQTHNGFHQRFCVERQESSDASDLVLNGLGCLTLALLDALFKNYLTVTEVHVPVGYTAHLRADLRADFFAH